MSQPEGILGDAGIMACAQSLMFLDLPDLILDAVLDRLDSSSLKKLRIVCQKTKSLVERPKCLERLMIYINSDPTSLQEIMNSTVQWNSFSIEMRYMSSIDDTAILSFIRMVRPRLSKLKIYGIFIEPKVVVTILANVGPSLRTFVFEVICLRGENPRMDLLVQIQELRDILHKSHNILQQNLIGVQHVIFCNMEWGGLNCASLLLNKFLECSPALATLKFPLIPLLFITEDPSNIIRLDESPDVHCAALLSYLSRNKHMSKIDFDFQHQSSIINFRDPDPRRDVRDGQTHGSPFPLSRSTLWELVKLCEPMGVKLYNVPTSALPNRHQIDPYMEQCYKKCVASILCANVVKEIPDTIYVPPGCPIKLMVSLIPQHNLNQFELSESLNVVSICFERNDLSGNNIDTLMNTLFRVVRRTVVELTLREMDTVIEVVRLINRLGSVFPNLKRLRLRNRKGGGVVRFGDWLNAKRRKLNVE